MEDGTVIAVGVAPGAEADADPALDVVELSYIAEDGAQQRVSLADSPGVVFELCAPVRRFAPRKRATASCWAAGDRPR
jgi:hypothetical protein